jgi:hypothetical protein
MMVRDIHLILRELIVEADITEEVLEEIKQVTLAQENAALKNEISSLHKKLDQRRIGINFLAKKGYPIPELRYEGYSSDDEHNYRLNWGGTTWVTEALYEKNAVARKSWDKTERGRWESVHALDQRIQELVLHWKRYKAQAAEGKFDGAAFSQSCVNQDITYLEQINANLHGRKVK